MSDPVGEFLRGHGATAVGPSLPQRTTNTGGENPPTVNLTVEVPPDEWSAITVPETPARPDEHPVRFIDGSQSGRAVLCLRAPDHGWPIPLWLAEVGAVALRLRGREFIRDFRAVERVLSFVVDPFPWQEVERFAAGLANTPELALRVLPANMPPVGRNLFDYEVMATQARARAQQEMATLERLALAVDRTVPTLVDGPLKRVMGEPTVTEALVVGVVKVQNTPYLHDRGWQTLLGLRQGQRTPLFQITDSRHSVASWYLKLAEASNIAPNWGYIRVEVPWSQFRARGEDRLAFVGRLSRWLVDARCRADSYARMPVSLDPIVRAEEALKPLFTSPHVLVNRLYRRAGLFRR